MLLKLMPEWQKYTFLIVGFTITFTLWIVAGKLGKINKWT